MILSSLGLGVACVAAPRLARSHWAVSSTFGVTPAAGTVDQTAMLQRAIDVAAKSRTPLFLPPGFYSTCRLELRSGTHLLGVAGKSILRYRNGGGVIHVEQAEDIRVDGLVLDGDGRDLGVDGALFAAANLAGLRLTNCRFRRSGSCGILVSHSGNVVVIGNIIDQAATGIALIDGTRGTRAAVIKGNLVRNLFFRKIALSNGNGIAIDANAAVVEGNAVENAPGFGILVGSDAREVSVTNNNIHNAHIGIGISCEIADSALIAGNTISGVKDGAVRAMDGPTPIGPDLSVLVTS
jgi:hypothetical protein